MGKVDIREPKNDRNVVSMQLEKSLSFKCPVSSNRSDVQRAHSEGWFSQEQALKCRGKESHSETVFHHYLNIASFL